jgi:hypothetical protein
MVLLLACRIHNSFDIILKNTFTVTPAGILFLNSGFAVGFHVSKYIILDI